MLAISGTYVDVAKMLEEAAAGPAGWEPGSRLPSNISLESCALQAPNVSDKM